MNIKKRLERITPDTSGITAANADLILERLEVLDPGPGSTKKVSIGELRTKNRQSWYSAHNLEFNNYLRQGAYKIRMYRRPNTGKEVLQVAAPFWGAILIHPTSNWRGLEGCIAPVKMYFGEPFAKIFGSHEAHKELMNALGPFEEGKEFTLWVANNPDTKPIGGQAQWFARKNRLKLAKMKAKAKK